MSTENEKKMRNKTKKNEEAALTKEMLRQKSDEELLQMVMDATGATAGEAFQQKFNCDFSYSFLTGELNRRGYITGWHNEKKLKELLKKEDEMQSVISERDKLKKELENLKLSYESLNKQSGISSWGGTKIPVNLNDNSPKKRITLTVNEDVVDQWNSVITRNNMKGAFATAALSHFLDIMRMKDIEVNMFEEETVVKRGKEEK